MNKAHDDYYSTVLEPDDLTPEKAEWVVGYLPGGGAMAIVCGDCGAKWCGRRAAWSKAECDGKHT